MFFLGNNLPKKFLSHTFAHMAKKSKDTVELIRSALKGMNLSEVARQNGMSVRQVRNIRDAKTKKPLWDTMVKLSKCLKIPLE